MYFPLVLRHYTHLKPFVFSVFCPPICPPICPCKSQKTPFFNFFCPTINLADFTHSSSQPSSIHPQKLPPFRSHSRTVQSSAHLIQNPRLNRTKSPFFHYHCIGVHGYHVFSCFIYPPILRPLLLSA